MTGGSVLTFHTLCGSLDKSLRRWGRSPTVEFSAFSDMVHLRLACVEQRALEQVALELHPRDVVDHDRAKACWRWVREAIEALRPSPSELLPEAHAALRMLPQAGKRFDVNLPIECHPYVVLVLAYVTKSHHNKEIAHLLGLKDRALATLRSKAVEEAASKLYQWEVRVLQGSSLQ